MVTDILIDRMDLEPILSVSITIGTMLNFDCDSDRHASERVNRPLDPCIADYYLHIQ